MILWCMKGYSCGVKVESKNGLFFILVVLLFFEILFIIVLFKFSNIGFFIIVFDFICGWEYSLVNKCIILL